MRIVGANDTAGYPGGNSAACGRIPDPTVVTARTADFKRLARIGSRHVAAHPHHSPGSCGAPLSTAGTPSWVSSQRLRARPQA